MEWSLMLLNSATLEAKAGAHIFKPKLVPIMRSSLKTKITLRRRKETENEGRHSWAELLPSKQETPGSISNVREEYKQHSREQLRYKVFGGNWAAQTLISASQIFSGGHCQIWQPTRSLTVRDTKCRKWTVLLSKFSNNGTGQGLEPMECEKQK